MGSAYLTLSGKVICRIVAEAERVGPLFSYGKHKLLGLCICLLRREDGMSVVTWLRYPL